MSDGGLGMEIGRGGEHIDSQAIENYYRERMQEAERLLGWRTGQVSERDLELARLRSELAAMTGGRDEHAKARIQAEKQVAELTAEVERLKDIARTLESAPALKVMTEACEAAEAQRDQAIEALRKVDAYHTEVAERLGSDEYPDAMRFYIRSCLAALKSQEDQS